MKKKFLLLLFAVALSYSSFFAQDNSKFTKDYIPPSPEKTWSLIKNPNAKDIVVGSVTITKRVAKYYHEGELNEISQEKAAYINYIYLQSFDLLTPQNQINNECLKKFKEEFDSAQFNYMRKQSEIVKIPIKFDGCNIEIALKPWDEVEKNKSTKK